MSIGGPGRRLWGRAVAAILLLAVTGCTSSEAPSADGAKPTPEPTVSLAGTGRTASYAKPVRIAVKSGWFASMQVSTATGDAELDGAVSADRLSWVSATLPRPGSSYRAVAQVKDGTGKVRSMTLEFAVAKVPDDKRVAFTVNPDDGATVGIGQPVAVRFLTPVTERAAMEKVMVVKATSPDGKPVKGSWSWLNSQQVDWKPDTFWTPGTTVSLDMKIAGVKAAPGRYGRKDYSETFTIGASHITRIDAASHRIRVHRDGKLVGTWPTGTGRRGLETYNGTYIVLGKSKVIQMDSCSARITCDKKDPDFYDQKVSWATRITASGTFLHAAGWDGQLGRANVSHGCIHLADADAKEFYQHAVAGDVVIVSNSGRGPQERIKTQDPGLYDWNVSRSAWKAGSAL